MSISECRASRTAGALLFVLAFVVAAIAVASLALRLRPTTSYAGIAITLTALIAMPVLAFLKRREARRSKNAALAADAVQSAIRAADWQSSIHRDRELDITFRSTPR